MTRGMSCFALLSLLLVGACAQECNTVVETGTEAGLSILLQAVQAADLVDAVNGPDAGLTILAPTNEAFEAALGALGVTAEDLFANKELLTEILTYHVLPTPSRAADFGDGGTFPTLLGDSSSCGVGDITVKVGDDGVTIEGGENSAKVVTADVEACTTIIHVIDAVLLPCPVGGEPEPTPVVEAKVEVVAEKKEEKMTEKKEKRMMKKEEKKEDGKCTTVVETAQAAGLTTLLAAVTAAGLAETVNNPDAGLTIFAPTDDAFAATLKALGITAEDLLADKDLLTTILTYHVLPTAYSARSLLRKRKVTTIIDAEAKCPKGSDVATDLKVSKFLHFFGPVRVRSKGTTAKVVKANIKACSTIIHVIDYVLLPCDEGCSSRRCKKFVFFG